MTRDQVIQRFENYDIIPAFEKVTNQLEIALQNEKNNFKAQFVEEFSQACRRQQEVSVDVVNRIMMLQFLRTDLLEGKLVYRIVFYDKEWYFGKTYQCGKISTDVIYQYYIKLEEILMKESLKYIGKVSKAYVKHYMGRLIGLFHGYMKELILYSLAEATETSEYQSLKKAEVFQIRLGEILEPGEIIFIENQNKNKQKIFNWISNGKKSTYCYQDWRDMDFAHEEFYGQDFRYSDFRNGNLELAAFYGCLLSGTKFKYCNMKACSLTGSLLHDADFTGADLMGADLSYCLSATGKDVSSDWKLTGYIGGSFKDADLRDAKLSHTVICGIDFRGARLSGTDWEGAVLFRSQFTRGQIQEGDFTKEQIQQIKVVE